MGDTDKEICPDFDRVARAGNGVKTIRYCTGTDGWETTTLHLPRLRQLLVDALDHVTNYYPEFDHPYTKPEPKPAEVANDGAAKRGATGGGDS